MNIIIVMRYIKIRLWNVRSWLSLWNSFQFVAIETIILLKTYYLI